MKRIAASIVVLITVSAAQAQTGAPGREAHKGTVAKSNAAGPTTKAAARSKPKAPGFLGASGQGALEQTLDPSCQQWLDLIRPGNDDSQG